MSTLAGSARARSSSAAFDAASSGKNASTRDNTVPYVQKNRPSANTRLGPGRGKQTDARGVGRQGRSICPRSRTAAAWRTAQAHVQRRAFQIAPLHDVVSGIYKSHQMCTHGFGRGVRPRLLLQAPRCGAVPLGYHDLLVPFRP